MLWLTLGLSWSAAQGIQSPGPLLMERLYRVELRDALENEEQGEPSPITELTCLSRTALPDNAGTFERRLLCLEGERPRLALYHLLDPEDRFPLQDLVVDVAGGVWIRLRAEFPKAAHLEDQESTEEWIARLSSGEFGRPMVRVDTDMLRFDPIGEDEDLEPYARTIWRDIDDREPELAHFLRWLASWLDSGQGKQIPGGPRLVAMLSRFAGLDAGETQLEVTLETIAQRAWRGRREKSLDPDMESAFGKWASWPDFPRLDD